MVLNSFLWPAYTGRLGSGAAKKNARRAASLQLSSVWEPADRVNRSDPPTLCAELTSNLGWGLVIQASSTARGRPQWIAVRK